MRNQERAAFAQRRFRNRHFNIGDGNTGKRAQPLLDDWLLFGAKAELFGGSARITDGQYPYGMAFSVGAPGTAGAMAAVFS